MARRVPVYLSGAAMLLQEAALAAPLARDPIQQAARRALPLFFASFASQTWGRQRGLVQELVVHGIVLGRQPRIHCMR